MIGSTPFMEIKIPLMERFTPFMKYISILMEAIIPFKEIRIPLKGWPVLFVRPLKPLKKI